MKDGFFKYYILVTQALVFMIVPPLLAWYICYRKKASKTSYIISITITTLIGVSLAITFIFWFLKKFEDKEKILKQAKERIESKKDENNKN